MHPICENRRYLRRDYSITSAPALACLGLARSASGPVATPKPSSVNSYVARLLRLPVRSSNAAFPSFGGDRYRHIVKEWTASKRV
jgi:hypothetical protein